MNRPAIFPIFFLFLLVGTGIKKYEHSYHIGSIVLAKIEPDQKFGRAKCQLDFTITNDSLIDGRFQIIDPPPDWDIVTPVTFHGTITHINSAISFGRHIKRIYPVIGTVSTYPDSSHPEASFEWETKCSFDNFPGIIKISKTKGQNHFIGRLEHQSQLSFYLE
jgi:hypothetical protein